MIKKLLVCNSDGYNARNNQALEAALMNYVKRGVLVLYLWSNDNAVFIGKNQNAYLECNLPLLESDGGVLCRRITGGGAVYHDKGNVNFTFIAQKIDYDEARQFDIIRRALNSLGLQVELTGRNDITLQGRKFSGNAFYKNDKIGLHHGTILIKSDYEKISKYLSASKLKLTANNVQSVAQRVINLSEVMPDINKEQVFEAIIKTAEEILLKDAPIIDGEERIEFLAAADVRKALIKKWLTQFSDEKHLLGDNIYYDARIEHKFSWGMADIRLSLEGNKITKVRIYSDTLDTGLIEKKESALTGEDIYNIKSAVARDILEVIKMEKFR